MARCLLVIRTSQEIDWEATFAGHEVLPTGRYLHYDSETGSVSGLPSWRQHGAVEPRFRESRRTTLVNCRTEIEHILAAERPAREEAEATVRAVVINRLREELLLELWATLFERTNSRAPKNAGEAFDRLMTAMDTRRDAQEELRELRSRMVQIHGEQQDAYQALE